MKNFKHAFMAVILLMIATSIRAQTKVISHRGAWKAQNLPENSLASLNRAAEIGCYGSEFDVHLTKDDVLVVNHDKEFYGIDIERATYQELLTKKHPNGERIPTLEEYLKEGKKHKKLRLVLEVKTSIISKERTLKTTEMCVNMVKRTKAKKQVDYICFDYDAGKRIHILDPKAEVAYLNGDVDPAQAKADGYTGLDYHFSVFKKNPDWIKEAHDLGLTVNAWTVDDEHVMADLIQQKVDFLTTNAPEKALSLIKAEQVK